MQQMTQTTADASAGRLATCMLVSLALGVVVALAYAHRERHTRSFVMALAMMPTITCVVISMVNGNVGAGVAVAGTFSLVRFRSAPGTGRDIAFVFLAMAIGLVTGMGYALLAVMVAAILVCAYLLLAASPLGRSGDAERTLTVSVPESLDYTGMFDGALDAHTASHRLLSVKTGAMGTVYKLTYSFASLGDDHDKALMDEARCLNGNLEVMVSEARSGSNGEL